MKRIIYLLAVALVISISFSSCQRKAITQEEIDEFSRQINERLEEINNNNKNNDTVITIDSTGTDTTVKINTNTPQTKQNTEITIIQRDNTNFGESIETVIIVFIAIITPFACLVLIVFFIIKGITSRQREHNKLIEKAIENNYPLPDKFFDTPKRHKSRLQSSLVWLAWGIGTMGFFYIVDPTETAYSIGLIPLLVGVAKLITYFVEDHKKESEE
mgnify:CR=1 FL=1